MEDSYLYIRDALKRVVICEAKKGNKIVGIAEGSSGNVKNIVIYKNVMVTVADSDNLVRVWSNEDGALLAVLKVEEKKKKKIEGKVLIFFLH